MPERRERQGPLAGVRIVELAGLGPAPLTGMILADLGADVVVIERPTPPALAAMVPRRFTIADRGKRRVMLDLKDAAGRDVLHSLIDHAGGLIEGFRPGTMERLGSGPDILLARRPSLVYVRITGWGQTGPRAGTAGHDIAYLAPTGALHAIGRADRPVPPLNLLGDYAGGSLVGVIGMLAALFEARASGSGQVVDVAMTDGVGLLLAPLHGMLQAGIWTDRRQANLLDGGAPFYDVYPTADGQFLAVGALEDEFFSVFAAGIGLGPGAGLGRWEPASWPALRREIRERIRGRTLDHWLAVFEGTDACVAPVRSLEGAAADPGQRGREAYIEIEGVRQPAPAPRFGRTPAGRPSAPPAGPTAAEVVLREWSA